MLERIDNMPEGTVGLAARGAVTAADCERTLLPLVAGRPGPDERTGMLLLFGPEFDDFMADALGNAQFAFNRWRDFGRLAIVSDVPWLRKTVRLLAPFMRGDVRLFHDYEVEQAKTWIATMPGGQRLTRTFGSARDERAR
jgi:hypothetical protein